MATVLQAVNNQLEFNSTKYRPIETYYVDDSYTNGVKAFRFASIKGDGTVGGVNELSLQYADAVNGIPAMGFFYDTSAIDRYGRTDNVTPETKLYPKGVRQNKGMGFAKRGEMMFADDDNFDLVKYFRGLDEVLASDAGGDTITVVTGTSDVTINCDKDLTGELKVGDYIKISDATNSQVVQVQAVTSTTITSNATLAEDYSTGAVITGLCMIGKPVYLVDADQATNVLPIQTLEPATSGRLKQVVGYVSSQGTYVIDLSIDAFGSIIA